MIETSNTNPLSMMKLHFERYEYSDMHPLDEFYYRLKRYVSEIEKNALVSCYK